MVDDRATRLGGGNELFKSGNLEIQNVEICRTGTLAVRRIALLVGKKSGEKFF